MKDSVFLKLTVALILIIATSQLLFSAGTPAGTIISNTATLTYKDLAGNSMPVVTATVEIIVAQKAGVALLPSTNSQIVGDSTWAYYPFYVTNTGNGKDIYDLSTISSKSWLSEIYVDANNNGVLEPVELAAGTVLLTDSLLADDAQYFVARIFIPKGTADNSIDSLQVSATSQFDATVTASGLYLTTVQRGIYVINKSQDVGNPIPEQTITYTLAFANIGSGPVTNVTVTDVLNINLTLINGSITGGGTYNPANRTITWSMSRLDGGESGNLYFQAKVNSGVVMGTTINNQASYTYTDSTSGLVKDTTSNTTTATVSLVSALSSTINPAEQIKDIGLPVQFHLTVTNNGNAVDSVRLDFASSQNFTWVFYYDVNGNGVIDDGESIIDPSKIGPLSAYGGTISLIAIDTILSTFTDQTLDSTRFTFTSLTTPSTSTWQDGKTTIRAPYITLSKSVSVVGGGQPIPGANLLYTINYSNSGSGATQSTVVTDTIPLHTDYVSNSTKLNGVDKTDVEDSDEVSCDGSVLTVVLGPLSASSSGTITFQVKIK